MSEQQENPVNIASGQTLSRTFKQEAVIYFEKVKEHLGTDGLREKDILTAFAEHLDGFNVFSSQMEILALQAARSVDREFMMLMIEKIGMPEAKRLAKIINDKHTHKRTVKTCQSETQNQKEEPSSESGKKESE